MLTAALGFEGAELVVLGIDTGRDIGLGAGQQRIRSGLRVVPVFPSRRAALTELVELGVLTRRGVRRGAVHVGLSIHLESGPNLDTAKPKARADQQDTSSSVR